MSDDLNNNSDTGVDQSHRQSRIAGLVVTVGSALFVFGLIALLFHHTNKLLPLAEASYMGEQSYHACTDSECREMLVEREIQRFRALRVETALLYRNEVHIATLIVGLSMAVLGAVLIFDRVRSATEEKAEWTREDGRKLFFVTSFPGILLCAMGTAVLWKNIDGLKSQIPISVYDARVLGNAATAAGWGAERPPKDE